MTDDSKLPERPRRSIADYRRPPKKGEAANGADDDGSELSLSAGPGADTKPVIPGPGAQPPRKTLDQYRRVDPEPLDIGKEVRELLNVYRRSARSGHDHDI